MTAYLGVTVHYITKDWELRSEVLSFAELEGRHSGENQAAHLYSVLKDYNVFDKVHFSIDVEQMDPELIVLHS